MFYCERKKRGVVGFQKGLGKETKQKLQGGKHTI